MKHNNLGATSFSGRGTTTESSSGLQVSTVQGCTRTLYNGTNGVHSHSIHPPVQSQGRGRFQAEENEGQHEDGETETIRQRKGDYQDSVSGHWWLLTDNKVATAAAGWHGPHHHLGKWAALRWAVTAGRWGGHPQRGRRRKGGNVERKKTLFKREKKNRPLPQPSPAPLSVQPQSTSFTGTRGWTEGLIGTTSSNQGGTPPMYSQPPPPPPHPNTHAHTRTDDSGRVDCRHWSKLQALGQQKSDGGEHCLLLRRMRFVA